LFLKSSFLEGAFYFHFRNWKNWITLNNCRWKFTSWTLASHFHNQEIW